MTDAFYSFDDTDALLASLSSSSATTLSPSDNGDFSTNSAKTSSYGLSPEEEFLNDNWDKGFNAADSNTLNDDFYVKNLVDFDANDGEIKTEETNNNNALKLENDLSNTFVSPESITGSDYSNSKPTNAQYSAEMLKRDTSLDSDLSETESPEFSSSSALKKTAAGDKNKVTKPKKNKATHNVIEKKYRTNINSKITALRDSVPALRMAAGDENTTINDLDGLSPAAKVNKAIVLTKATEYIKHLERKNALLMRENQQMKHYLGSIPAQQHHQQQQQFYPQQHQQQFNVPPNQFQTSPLQNSQQSPDSFQPANYNGQQVPMANAQQPYQMGVPGKVLMGGMATMVGQNLFSGGDYGDYRGLSAFPIMGNPLFIKFFHLVQFLFVSLSVIYLIAPALFQKSQSGPKDKKTKVASVEWYELVKELVFIQIGSKPKREATQGEIDILINQVLLSPERHSIFSLSHLLLKLFTYQTSFEVSFGKLVVAKLLLAFTDVATFINLNSIITTSLQEIANQKVSDSNLRYFFKELKTTSAKNTESFKRLLNIIIGLPINTNCERGIEDKGYFLILRDERVLFDYKTLLISLRANEVFREVLLEYINLTFNQDEIDKLDNDELKETKKELWNKLSLAENLAPKRSIVDIRIKLFKSILNEKYVDSVLQLVSEESKALITTKKLNGEVVEEKTSTESSKLPSPVVKEEDSEEEEDEDDEEIYDFDEFSEESDIEQEQEQTPKAGKVNELKSNITKINPKFQNLLSQDLFNALVTSSILKYAHADQHEQVFKLLKYIRFSKDELTLLSFISLYKLVQKFPKKWLEGKEGQVIENLVGHLRVWVGDSSNVNFNDLKELGLHLKREISDQLVQTGKSFSELN